MPADYPDPGRPTGMNQARMGSRADMDTSPGADTRCQDIIDRVVAARVGVAPWPAVSAVLETLGEVLPYGTAAYLAASLPDQIGAEVGRHFPNHSPASAVVRTQV